MNNPTFQQLSTGQNLSQPTQQDDAYSGEMLVTLTEYCTIFQQLSDITLDMDIEE